MDWVLLINNNSNGDLIILLAKMHLGNICKIFIDKSEIRFNNIIEKKVIHLLNSNLAMMDNLYLIADKMRINDMMLSVAIADKMRINDMMPSVARRVTKIIDEDTFHTIMGGLSKTDNLLLSNYKSLLALKN